MENSFAKSIRRLRRQRELTQEQLAERLNVSPQAVSKWETGNACPDLGLLPVIAGFFGTSIDHLVGYDRSGVQERVEEICWEAERLFDERQYMAAVGLLRDALRRYPGEEELMYRLAWALSGTIRETPENYEEAIALYHRLLAVSERTELRCRVMRDLVYRYSTMREPEKARRYAEQLPAFGVCREYTLGRANVLEGRELAAYLLGNIRLYSTALCECLEYFENGRILTEEEKLPCTTEMASKWLMQVRDILGQLA